MKQSRSQVALRFAVANASRRTGIEQRFWKHVEKTDSCWNWTGATDRAGYGKFWLMDDLRVRASRMSWTLKHGRPPENDMCHHCDNPPCVNPDHLFDGTKNKISRTR